jgi:hypothetical protein
VSSHVSLLRPEVRSGEWRSSQVCTQQFHLADVLVFDDPNEARAEHGVGGFDHFDAESVVAREGFFDIGDEDRGGFCLLRGEAAEEDVIVAGHGGVIEERGFVRRAAVFFDETLGFGCCIGGALKGVSKAVDGRFEIGLSVACLWSWSLVFLSSLIDIVSKQGQSLLVRGVRQHRALHMSRRVGGLVTDVLRSLWHALPVLVDQTEMHASIHLVVELLNISEAGRCS